MRFSAVVFVLAAVSCRQVSRQGDAAVADQRIDNAGRADFPAVIMYHEIREDKAYNHFDVMRSDFEAQLDWLKAKGYRTLSISEYERAIGTPQARSSVLISFDDGYAGNFKVAAPLLRARGMKAVFFQHVGSVGSLAIARYPIMTWEELRSLDAEPLFEVQSHTVTHPDLTALSSADLRVEMEQSRETLKQKLGGERTALAYPMGKYDRKVMEAASAAGYTLAFSVSDKGGFGAKARYSIPRIYMGTVMADLDFFERCVTSYASLPPDCFAERWAPVE